jgi:hypothetical protein
MKKPTQAGAARLKAARKAAAKDLGLAIKDWRALRYALLSLEHEKLQAIAAGDGNVDIDKLLRIEAAMQEIRAGLPVEIPKVQIEIIGGTDDAHCHAFGCGGDVIEICTCCGRIPGEDPAAAPKRPPPQLEWNSGPSVAAPAKLTLVDSTPAPAVPPPPISRPRGVSASKFHDQQLPDGSTPPIKRSAISGGGSGSLVWSGYESGTREFGTAATPDAHPYIGPGGRNRY